MTQVRFLAPSPLWDDLAGSPAHFRAPALLRFAGDDFVDQWQAALGNDPRSIRGFVARPETWRAPVAGIDRPASTAANPLRLYQPVHGRFYLAAASLACRVPGLPEHTVDAAKGEVVAFVLRRITVAAGGAETGEWGWIKRADGGEGWARSPAAALAADEETLPMFASAFATKEKGVPRRRVFAGLIPASRRETYASGRELAAQAPPPAPGSLDDPRMIDFHRAVLDPWTELKSWWDGQRGMDAPHRASALDSAEVTTAYLLLDLYDWLARTLPTVRAVVDGASPTTITGARRTLYDRLNALGVHDRDGGNRVGLAAAMRHAVTHRAALEALTGSTLPGGYVRRVLVGDPRAPGVDPDGDEARLVALFARVAAPRELDVPPVGVRDIKKLAMDAVATAGPAPGALPEQLPARKSATADGDEWFVVRCVYLKPNCGKKTPPVVSDRSERFRLTSFFDPDAPARHLRVALPVDTSPATLRKYNHNVAFVLSDQLRKQMSRASSLKDLMDGKAGSEGGGLDFAVVCSFSIPIITICALILLMILVSLLNIVFWWLPLFKICFPIPKPKG